MEGEEEDRETDWRAAGREVWMKGKGVENQGYGEWRVEGCGELGIWGVEGGRV